MDPDEFTCPSGLHRAEECYSVRKTPAPVVRPVPTPRPIAKVRLDTVNIEAGKAAVRAAFEAGKQNVIGDFSDTGHLYAILSAMGAEFTTE